MLSHLPLPYPDELLYSVIARYLKHIGTKLTDPTIIHLFGYATYTRVDLPVSLDAVSERTWPIWHMSGEQIVKDLTLFPYYSRYMSEENTKANLQFMLSKPTKRFLTSNVTAPRFLRFCWICRDSDMSKYGETYWHRSHQLAGALVCPQHGNLLTKSAVSLYQFGQKRYIDATSSTRTINESREVSYDKNMADKALKVATRCQDILLGKLSSWPTGHERQSYRQLAMVSGYGAGTLLSNAKIRTDFVSYYGDKLLCQLAYDIHFKSDAGWLTVMLGGSLENAFHPAEHALVQVFLESTSINPLKIRRFGSGPWKCPNPYAHHEKSFPIEKITVHTARNGQLVASARCSCGDFFSFLDTSADDVHLPVVRKYISYGPDRAAEAGRLRSDGLSLRAIARRMNTTHRVVTRLLSHPLSSHAIFLAQVPNWRQEWLTLLENTPNRSRHLARKQNRALYERLCRCDKEWLQSEGRITQRNHAKRGPLRIWDKRDSEWSSKLMESAMSIRKAVPIRKITKALIICDAGLSAGILTSMDRLPKCRAAIEKFSESTDDYIERRLRAAAATALDMGKHLTTTSLRRLSLLYSRPLSPRLIGLMQELIEKSSVSE